MSKDETVERISPELIAQLNKLASYLTDQGEYEAVDLIDTVVARATAMPSRELLREALGALDFYANKDNHKMRREPSYRDRFSQNMKPGRPKLGRVSEDKGKRARAAADKIRAALTEPT